MNCSRWRWWVIGSVGWLCAASAATRAEDTPALRKHLDAPLLFVKRHNYTGIHIYDTYYKWRPGGGIYVIENPSAPPAERTIRALIDATTDETLGGGIYNEPELSWDARRVLFCHKPTANGSTSIYEIGIDGKHLRRLTRPTSCESYCGRNAGQHDVGPAYLPDGRIVFTSTRYNGLVPCNNTAVDILHVMNADGTDVRCISVNNVNEFDPTPLPDGRILHGRWEYVDKTALTQQSVWTIFPDGTNEVALFANNMVHPEAILDARPVPGSPHLIVGTMTPHNAPPRGCVGIIDPQAGKNAPGAIVNFDTPDRPTNDRGNSCEPWPLSIDTVLYSARPRGAKFNALVIADRRGRRVVVHQEPDIDCHSPMLVKPRPRPPVLAVGSQPKQRTGRLFVQDVYQGLDGVRRGDIKSLRVIEETSRTTGTHGSAMNQTFLMSAVLAWSAKNFLGVAPVETDGSAYFEVPSGRAVYLQALDGQGRMVRGMRTFFQAAPGVTRSCVGCHEYKYSAPTHTRPAAVQREPSRLRDESWGSGYVDYPSMIQPILDKHCVSCHGGEKGFSGGLDLTGGWTAYFSLSYENLVNRRKNQLTASLISGIDCMNGTSFWSAQIFGPYGHGSGAAPLARRLVGGHKGRIKGLSRSERDLMLAWIDTNGLYHGTWDYAPGGSEIRSWKSTKNELIGEMHAAGCMKCHGGKGPGGFENDWFNLRRPEWSRILRAPLARGADGFGAGLCQRRKVDSSQPRLRMLWRGYRHAATPIQQWQEKPAPPAPPPAEPVATFASTGDEHYRKMLAIIRRGRDEALARPRTDMPGAVLTAGIGRQLIPTPLPEPLPSVRVGVEGEGIVRLAWERSARTIGLSAKVHRGPDANFTPSKETLLAATRLHQYADLKAPVGQAHYAVVLFSGDEPSQPIRVRVTVPPPAPPAAPTNLKASDAPGCVELAWQAPAGGSVRYHVYRAEAGKEPKRLTAEPIGLRSYGDTDAAERVQYTYTVRAVNRREMEGPASAEARGTALPEVKTALFVAALTESLDARLASGAAVKARRQGKARIADGSLDLLAGGHVTYDHRAAFDLTRRISIECWVRIEKPTSMPVVVSCGRWNQAGWFLQRIGAGWRWHVGGIDCDGGKGSPGQWTHLVGTFDGQTTRLFQDGRKVGERTGSAVRSPWSGRLHVGQYSGGPGSQYQVIGRIAGLKVYGRALPAKDVATAAATGPAKPKP